MKIGLNQNWATLRGAVLPEQKSDLLHICRRKNCSPLTIQFGDIQLQSRNKLRIIGIMFTKKNYCGTVILNI